jgi:hypothetical protein
MSHRLCWERALITIFYIVEIQDDGTSESMFKGSVESISRSRLLKLLRILAQSYTCRYVVVYEDIVIEIDVLTPAQIDH